MGFKKISVAAPVHAGPDQLFLDLPRRKYGGLLDHQGQMLRTYADKGLDAPDVALQLPTGSGKTLVGLLIAEWRRRKYSERVVYLCPTRQLVNQVAEEASTKYGLEVDAFTGSSKDYDAAAKSRYMSADRVAVTTYNSLFNTNPFFKSPEVVILDDAHAAENYVAKMWTLQIGRKEHAELFQPIAWALKPHMHPTFHTRLVEEPNEVADYDWIDKLPSPAFAEVSGEISAILDSYNGDDSEIVFVWKVLRNNLTACHLYMTAQQLLIRPLIPPTWSHAPFKDAKQRIFMSATLGRGGDLERLTGRRKILRLPIPAGWDRQGIGRRFFMFPGMSMQEEQLPSMRKALMEEAGRSLVLVPSTRLETEMAAEVKTQLGYQTFSAEDIEKTKTGFLACQRAVAIVANRYDGIDFPGDDCRLLFVEGLPKAVNLQERFLMTRMGATVIFNERIQTRVLQAVGRCTRGLNDYSAVVVSDGDLADYLVDKRRRGHLHPELQAEIEFGLEQSKDTDEANLLDLFRIFKRHDAEWEEASQFILNKRDVAQQAPHEGIDELEKSVTAEVDFQMRMWQGDYAAAFDEAREVLAALISPALQGYRALWHYLAGSAAILAEKEMQPGYGAMARQQFGRAREAAKGIPWLVALSRYQVAATPEETRNSLVLRQIERVENVLSSLGVAQNRNYNKREQEILHGLSRPETFEQAQKSLGEMLGFIAGKVEEDASPDPWWLADELAIVFEDHAGAAPDVVIDAKKARQAVSHEAWMRANVPAAKEAKIVVVLVTPATSATKGSLPSLASVAYWHVDEFKSWAHNAMGVLRNVRASFSEPGDIDWRLKAAEAFEQAGIDVPALFENLQRANAARLLQTVAGE